MIEYNNYYNYNLYDRVIDTPVQYGFAMMYSLGIGLMKLYEQFAKTGDKWYLVNKKRYWTFDRLTKKLVGPPIKDFMFEENYTVLNEEDFNIFKTRKKADQKEMDELLSVMEGLL